MEKVIEFFGFWVISADGISSKTGEFFTSVKFAKNIPRTRQLIAIPAPMPIDGACIRLIFLGVFCVLDLDEFSGGFVGYDFLC